MLHTLYSSDPNTIRQPCAGVENNVQCRFAHHAALSNTVTPIQAEQQMYNADFCTPQYGIVLLRNPNEMKQN